MADRRRYHSQIVLEVDHFAKNEAEAQVQLERLGQDAVDALRDGVTVPKIRFRTAFGIHNIVRPVKDYCDALMAWRKALTEKVTDLKAWCEANPDDRTYDYYRGELERTQQLVESLNAIELPIRKSNLLWRLIYLGLPLRARKCPQHQGRWSGYAWENPCACNVGYDVTGWLPEEEEQINYGGEPVETTERLVGDG